MVICDCTTLTQAGYVGDDIESVIAKLLHVCHSLIQYNCSQDCSHTILTLIGLLVISRLGDMYTGKPVGSSFVVEKLVSVSQIVSIYTH